MGLISITTLHWCLVTALMRGLILFLSSTLIMAGGNLEVFKFGVYLFVPILTMLHFASPEWYNEHVVPVRIVIYLSCPPNLIIQTRDRFWPPEDKTNVCIVTLIVAAILNKISQKPPTNPTDLHAELTRLRAERLARRAKQSSGAEPPSDH